MGRSVGADDVRAGGPALRLWNRNFVLLMAANTCVVCSYLMLMPTFPLYVRSLGNREDVVGWLTGVFTLTAMMARPVAGRALDAGLFRRTYLFGQLVSLVSILAYPIVPSTAGLLAFRLLHGVGIGVTTTSAQTIVTEFVPKDRLAEGIGYFGLGSFVAMAVAPALGLYVADTFGFAAVFAASACMMAFGAAFGLAVRYARRLGAGRSVPPSALLERSAALPAAVAFCAGVAHSAVTAFAALYAESRGVEHIGVFFTVFAFAVVLSRPIAGKIADRKGVFAALIPGLVAVVAATAAMAAADRLALFLAIAVLLGVGHGAAINALQTMAVLGVDGNRRGAAVSTFYLGLDLAAGLGPALGGTAVSRAGYPAMFLLASTCSLVGLIASIAVVRRAKSRAKRRHSA